MRNICNNTSFSFPEARQAQKHIKLHPSVLKVVAASPNGKPPARMIPQAEHGKAQSDLQAL